MVRKKKGGSFRGKTRANSEKRKRGAGYGYLVIPKDVKVFSPDPDSKYLMDILPYEVKDKKHPDRDDKNEIAVEGTLWYKRPFKTHRQVGVNNDTVVCPRSFGKKCPICDLRDKLRKDEGDEDEIKALRPSDRNLYAVIIIGASKIDEVVHLFDFSDYLFQERFEEQLQDDERFEIFPDHEEGCSLNVRFAENQFGQNKFADPTRFDFVDREQQYGDDVLDEVPCLDDCFTVLSYDELHAKFFEVDEEETETEKPKETEPEDEPAPTTTKRTPRRSPKPKEDEIPPRIGTRRSSRKPKEEEKEEEVPTTTRRSSRRSAAAEAPKEEETCPSGHTFGASNDEFDDCDDCPLWNECFDKSGKE